MKLKDQRIIAPISHARMENVQRPETTLATLLGPLAAMIEEPTCDVDLVFTTGLYQNNNAANMPLQRLNLLQREAEWRIRFSKGINEIVVKKIKANNFDVNPSAITFVNWDENALQYWNEFNNFYRQLRQTHASDKVLQKIMEDDLAKMGRDPTSEHIRFMCEEIAVTGLWLRGLLTTKPRVARQEQLDTIIAYPGEPSMSMLQGLEIILSKRSDIKKLLWLNTEDANIKVGEYQFGRKKRFIAL